MSEGNRMLRKMVILHLPLGSVASPSMHFLPPEGLQTRSAVKLSQVQLSLEKKRESSGDFANMFVYLPRIESPSHTGERGLQGSREIEQTNL